jgi:hypothetical protein
MRVALLLGLVMIAGPAAAAEQQFDLICAAKQTNTRYRIDLDRGEWCEGACEVTKKLVSVTSGELVLEDRRPVRRADIESRTRINRVTGAWFTTSFNRAVQTGPDSMLGKCTPEPFSGFPPAKF